jgi:putative transposase
LALAYERGLSQRRACELLEVARSALKYESVRNRRDVPAIKAMKRLAAQYPHYGYRRIRIFLRREGLHMSADIVRIGYSAWPSCNCRVAVGADVP